MIKYTAGPWLREGRTVYALMSAGFLKGVEQSKNRFWATVYHDREVSEDEAEATVCLIQSASGLLEACQACADGRKGWQQLMHAAIAKATGDKK